MSQPLVQADFAGDAADVSALRGRVSKLALDFPLYDGLEEWGLMSRI